MPSLFLVAGLLRAAFAEDATPVRWGAEPIVVEIALDGCPEGIDQVEVETAVVAAIQTWNEHLPPEVQIIPTSLDGPRVDAAIDERNVLVFAHEDWVYETETMMVTLTFEIETARIYDADIVLNGSSDGFVVGDSFCGPSSVQSTLLHGLGHFLGMRHSDDPKAVMSIGSCALELSDDDLAQLQYLYVELGPVPVEPEEGEGAVLGCSISSSSSTGARGSLPSALFAFAVMFLARHRQLPKRAARHFSAN